MVRPTKLTSEQVLSINRSLCEKSYYHFLREAWPIIDPSVDFSPNWHIQAICEHLEAVSRGEILRLVINVPPRHCKSITSNVGFLPWLWTHAPGTKLMTITCEHTLASRDAVASRRVVRSDWYRSMWPSVQLFEDANQIANFVNNQGGRRFATTVGGSVIGQGADIIIGDDLHKIQEIHNDRARQEAVDFWLTTAPGRLDNKITGRMVLIMQRLHQADVAAESLKQGGWVHLNLPAEYEPDNKCFTVIGFDDPRKVEGELLWPAKMGAKEIEKLKLAMKTEYWGQYQQRPVPKGGQLFKRNWFRYWESDGDIFVLKHGEREVRVAKKDCFIFGVLDPADSDDDRSAEACYSVCQVWARTPHHDLLLLDQYRKKVSIPTLGNELPKFLARHQPAFVCVEKNGVGRHAIKDLQSRGIAVKPLNASKGKEERSEAAQTRMQSGQVFHPAGASFLFEYEEELEHFPKSEFFDQVDCLSHAASFVQLQATGYDGDSEDGGYIPTVDGGVDERGSFAGPSSPVYSVNPQQSWQCHVAW